MSSNEPDTAALSIWDWPVRLLHWMLVASLIAAWMTRHERGPWHEWFGYGAAGIVALRIGWGFAGTHYARFAQFVRSPSVTLVYARTVLRGHAPRHLGHNPLGGWMVLTLLGTLSILCLSGWLFTTDWLWGYAWLSNTHVALAWLLVGLAALHVAGVAFTCWHQRENLVRAMFDGRKRAQ